MGISTSTLATMAASAALSAGMAAMQAKQQQGMAAKNRQSQEQAALNSAAQGINFTGGRDMFNGAGMDQTAPFQTPTIAMPAQQEGPSMMGAVGQSLLGSALSSAGQGISSALKPQTPSPMMSQPMQQPMQQPMMPPQMQMQPGMNYASMNPYQSLIGSW